MSIIKSCCAFLLIAFATSACHKRPPATSPSRTIVTPPPSTVTPRPPAPAPPPRAVASPPPAPLTEAELFQRKSLEELNAEHPLGDVFFDYEQNTLRDDARRILEQDVRWLTKWPTTIVRVDGHCDERGTAEYNLALGDRRANAVKEYLVSLGVRPDRIQMRSLGKEAPFCQASGESCWSQNRRGHFMLTAK